jgi:hypothetical protein
LLGNIGRLIVAVISLSLDSSFIINMVNNTALLENALQWNSNFIKQSKSKSYGIKMK